MGRGDIGIFYCFLVFFRDFLGFFGFLFYVILININ